MATSKFYYKVVYQVLLCGSHSSFSIPTSNFLDKSVSVCDNYTHFAVTQLSTLGMV